MSSGNPVRRCNRPLSAMAVKDATLAPWCPPCRHPMAVSLTDMTPALA